MDGRFLGGDEFTLDAAHRKRPGSVAPPVTVDALGQGVANTFFVPVELLPQLEARIYSGFVSFRVLGPNSAEDNLFSWDSGYGGIDRPRTAAAAGCRPAPAVPRRHPRPGL
ncbi:MAG: hypothetical protein R2873_09390 [Caldilineaceae bacterium]